LLQWAGREPAPLKGNPTRRGAGRSDHRREPDTLWARLQNEAAISVRHCSSASDKRAMLRRPAGCPDVMIA